MTTPIVTIVGGSGFIGRHAIKRFADAGWRINVLCRDIIAAEYLKTAGVVGQIVLQRADITDPKTLEGKFAGSDVVINLVSILYQTSRNQKFDRINVDGAKNVAEQAKKVGAKKLIHISALNPCGDSKYGRTKQDGEVAVAKAFPNATILRPSLVIGEDDEFFQRFGRLSMISPFLPIVAGGGTRFQPVTVENVADAVFAAATQDTEGKIYELGGPKIYSMKELMKLLLSITGRHNRLISLPKGIALLMGLGCELLPFRPQITRDQVRMMGSDSILCDTGFDLRALGVTPTVIESVLPGQLERFNKR